MIVSDLKTAPRSGRCKGACANCQAEVYEDLLVLDDAYNVWMGRCPSCKALNYLSMNFYLRGYTREEMRLVLPTAEEIAANGLPPDTPSSGVSGKPATAHGTLAGELAHTLFGDDR